MTVEVISSPSFGIGSVATSFSDFNGRPDEPFFFGDSWYTGIFPDTATSTGAVGNDISASTNVVAGDLVLGNIGLNMGNGAFYGVPIPVYPPLITTRAQFSEMRLVAGSNGGVATGPAVFINGNRNAGNGYMARTFNNAGNRQIILARNLNAASITSLSGPINVNYGDTIRLEIRPLVGSNDLNMLVNGVSVFAFNDNNAGRSQFGMFGICHNGTTFATDTWDTYRGGTL